MGLHYKVIADARLKTFDEGNGGMEGYAATFTSGMDRVGETFVKDAFTEVLPAFVRDGFIAVGHDWKSMPIATVTEAFEDDYGLFFRAEFHSDPDAQMVRTRVRERIERGKAVKVSVGFRVPQGGSEQTAEGTLIKKAELFEVSIVNVPANPSAMLLNVKDAGLSFDEHEEAVLAAVSEYTDRLKDLSDLRAKAGRVLSGENRRRIERGMEALTAAMQTLQDMLRMADTREATKELVDADHLYAEFVSIQSKMMGVMLS